MKHRAFFIAILTTIIPCTTQLFGQKGLPAKEIVTLTHTTNYAQQVDFRPDMVNQLTVPPGWKVNVAATGLGKPGMLYTGPNGEIYVTRRDAGDVLMLKDNDGDNKFDDMDPATATMNGSQLWIMNSKFNELADSNSVPSKKFALQMAVLKPVN